MNALCDPSTPDVTGQILEAFGQMIYTAREENIDPDLIACIRAVSQHGIAYLAHAQESTGPRYGRWGINYIYGTGNALCGLEYFIEEDCRVQNIVSQAINWLIQVQKADGAWTEIAMTPSVS